MVQANNLILFIIHFCTSNLVDNHLIEQTEKMLVGQSLQANRDFKLEISCDENEFVVNLNETWEEKLAYNASVIDHIVEIGVSGAITVYKAGYTGEVITCFCIKVHN